MKIGFIIYNDMTALDFVGIYDPLTRLKTMGFMPDLTWEICSFTQEIIDGTGLQFMPTKVGASLAGYDIVVVPGGLGSRRLMHDAGFIEWIKTAAACNLKVSVCTGSLLLGAAGMLKGRRATTHPGAIDLLAGYCQQVVMDRVADAGDIITARGVTSAIDVGLYVCEKLTGYEIKEKIRQQMDYQTI
jgi:transcriptional regulator GlxA family with amidase domain